MLTLIIIYVIFILNSRISSNITSNIKNITKGSLNNNVTAINNSNKSLNNTNNSLIFNNFVELNNKNFTQDIKEIKSNSKLISTLKKKLEIEELIHDNKGIKALKNFSNNFYEANNTNYNSLKINSDFLNNKSYDKSQSNFEIINFIIMLSLMLLFTTVIVLFIYYFNASNRSKLKYFKKAEQLRNKINASSMSIIKLNKIRKKNLMDNSNKNNTSKPISGGSSRFKFLKTLRKKGVLNNILNNSYDDSLLTKKENNNFECLNNSYSNTNDLNENSALINKGLNDDTKDLSLSLIQDNKKNKYNSMNSLDIIQEMGDENASVGSKESSN